MLHLERLNREPSFRAVEMAMCARDVAHWCNAWGWTYDPREPTTALPFDLWPKQAAFLGWLNDRERLRQDGLVEKSRDTGLTWLCVVYATHGWLFRSGFSAGFGSRKLELVDRLGDPDSIFEKIRALIGWLPHWMLPQGYKPQAHSHECRLINPANGSTITGEGGDNIGRGGRKSVYFVDEAAFIDRPHMLNRSLSQTTRCRIDVSTPNGPGNAFAEKRFSLPPEQVFTMHWRDDPRKDDAWYANECKRLDKVTVAQEIDIDYTASVEGVTIPATWVRAAVSLKLPASGDLIVGLDVAERGSDRCVFTPRQGPVVADPVDWGECNTTETALRACDEMDARKAAALCYDCVGVGAGVRGTLESSGRKFEFVAEAVNTGAAPGETIWPDGRTSRERFLNLRAELWWLVRARFEKTYEHVTGKAVHPPEEMISIPNHPTLIAQLSQPLSQRTAGGKIKVESKDDMRARGVKSPDFADSLILAYAVDSAWGDFALPTAARTMMSQAPREVVGAGVLAQQSTDDARDDADDARADGFDDAGDGEWGGSQTETEGRDWRRRWSPP